MNYIEQINGFWNKSEEADLTGLDIAVYMALLKYCNRLNWLNPFVCHWDIVCQTSKVSKNAYYKSLERLNDFGFIKSEKGIKNTNQKPKIFILELKNNQGIIKEQQGNRRGTEEEQQGNLYKHLNNLTNKQVNAILEFYDNLSASEVNFKISEFKEYSKNDKINFDVFWDLYDKKEGDKKSCLKKWNDLPSAEQQKIIDTLPSFKAKISSKQYQPLPATYLNQRRWNDELEDNSAEEYTGYKSQIDWKSYLKTLE